MGLWRGCGLAVGFLADGNGRLTAWINHADKSQNADPEGIRDRLLASTQFIFQESAFCSRYLRSIVITTVYYNIMDHETGPWAGPWNRTMEPDHETGP